MEIEGYTSFNSKRYDYRRYFFGWVGNRNKVSIPNGTITGGLNVFGHIVLVKFQFQTVRLQGFCTVLCWDAR